MNLLKLHGAILFGLKVLVTQSLTTPANLAMMYPSSENALLDKDGEIPNTEPVVNWLCKI